MATTYLHPEFRALRTAREEGLPLNGAWEAFRKKALANSDHPPPMVSEVMAQVMRQQGDRPPSSIKILDHGCGGGFILMYFLAVGYTEIYGIDVETNEVDPVWNDFCRDVAGLRGQRFHTYDGWKMPFDDGSFDIIFSTQVIEHVEDRFWDSYFSEESRVLKHGGSVFHEIPHRLGPYESHTNTWFLHYLPRKIHSKIYCMTGRGAANSHYLRMPTTIRRALRRHIGDTQEYTLHAFLENSNPEDFDGPSLIRRVIYTTCMIPIIGPIIQTIIRPMLMMRIRATKANI